MKTAPKPRTLAKLPTLTADDITALRLAAIVESSDDAIVSKNLDSVIQTWNPAAERMFGYTAAEAIGRSIRIIIPAERQGEEDDVMRRIRAGETINHYETVRIRKDGTPLNVSLTVSSLRASDGTVIGASKIARDITEQRRLQTELADANRIKDLFLATLSHELRTPLNAILGYTKILRTPGIDADARARAAEVIERNGHILSKLVSDVLDISTIVAGKTKLNVRPSDLVAILGASLDVVRPAAAARGVDLEIDADVEQAAIDADADRLQQVFWNLLSNAVKFTPRGGRITARLRWSPEEVSVEIADTGAGIDPAFLPYIFHKFRQGNTPPASGSYRGLGLGLALVRHFVELHGGHVTAESEGPGRGSTFRVTLPVAQRRMGSAAEGPRLHDAAGPRTDPTELAGLYPNRGVG